MSIKKTIFICAFIGVSTVLLEAVSLDPSRYGKIAKTVGEVIAFFENDLSVLREQRDVAITVNELEDVRDQIFAARNMRVSEIAGFLLKPSTDEEQVELRDIIRDINETAAGFNGVLEQRIDALKKASR